MLLASFRLFLLNGSEVRGMVTITKHQNLDSASYNKTDIVQANTAFLLVY